MSSGLLVKYSSILTASNFVAAVQAVALHVAVIALRDTLFVAVARKLIVTAWGSRGRRSAVFLIAAVCAIFVAVTTPQLADALLIIASKLVGLASVRTCRKWARDVRVKIVS